MKGLVIIILCLLKACQCLVRERYFPNGTSVICRGVVCPKNHIFVPCTYGNGTDDSCQRCPSDRPISVESFESAHFDEPPYEVCTDPKDKCSCSKEAKLVNPEECFRKLNRICQCRVEEGYYGKDPDLCRYAENPRCLEPGFQLTIDGHCQSCSEGTYKEAKGYGLCISQPVCNKYEEVDFPGNTARRRTCKIRKIQRNVTNYVYTQNGSPGSGLDYDIISTMKPKEINVTEVQPSNRKDLTILGAVLGSLAGAAVLFIIVICCCCRRKGNTRMKTNQSYICIYEPNQNGTNADKTRENTNQPKFDNTSERLRRKSETDHEDLHQSPDTTCPDSKISQNATVPTGILSQGATLPPGSLSQGATLPSGSLSQGATLPACRRSQVPTLPAGSFTQNGNLSPNTNVSAVSLSNCKTEHVNKDCEENKKEPRDRDICIQIDDDGDGVTNTAEHYCSSLGGRTEPDGAENEAGHCTFVKEVCDGSSQKVDKCEGKSVNQRDLKSKELNVSSLLSSGLPSSNSSVPSIGLNRVEENYPHVPVPVSLVAQQTDSGIGSQIRSTGAGALDNQPDLSLGDFDSDSGCPINQDERR